MKRNHFFTWPLAVLASQLSWAQIKIEANEKINPIVQNFVNEVNTNSQLEGMAYELLDGIGPRLVGTPEMLAANEWTANKLKSWDIEANLQQFGTWRGWQRGITHVDMTHPRIKSLSATQLGWCPSTKKPIEAEVIILPKVSSKSEFDQWLSSIKGKIVLMSQYQKIGRSDEQIKEFGTPELYEKLKAEKELESKNFRDYMKNIGYDITTLPQALEKAGAVGIAVSNWTGIMGASRIFGAKTTKTPMIDIEMEDYGMLYRMAEKGAKPQIKIETNSKQLPEAKTFNTIGIIKGKEKPNEYVVLSAHLDSWDGAQGATDNGTGTLTMLETMRILKKEYPNNKRTIVLGLWGSEEQGLNGSRSFIEDNPEIAKGIQAVFNQDNGTGRVVGISGQGFVKSYDYIGRWLNAVPKMVKDNIKTDFPSMPDKGGSDHSSFVAAGIPGFSLGSLNWGYFGYTWHTTKDTYDKIVFDELKNNVVLAATLAYMASEDPEFTSREKRVMPQDEKGESIKWPEMKKPIRSSKDFK
ncbi:M20/M25/M40 family metallo-hydrolase [Chryseobacterium potabilaquae]|uniref:Carboxypeptidase Q n=1 Tax=Chryseobacterium potabilaquae TaxID=2675057 RepID=A0A6N4XD03_9FLAO|nr:M20/M25/M40 family metallo-hydrolase [Chryseobacterium potabilaquae]CAA7197344.1 Aminopeptidase YwaD [Chryseobacterium potabilaquae]